MVWPFSRGANRDDFSAYLNDAETSKKKELIAECQRRGVTIFIDKFPNDQGLLSSLLERFESPNGVPDKKEPSPRRHVEDHADAPRRVTG